MTDSIPHPILGGVGFGIYPMQIWHRILSELPIDAMLVHNHYCLNDSRALELLPAVNTKDIALINASSFAGKQWDYDAGVDRLR